ncbi:MAG: hypothetical protein JO307_17510 [Bryobacterales bacterium]|nr:hypothetical protein [Bryobacterales bacterium]MBV9397425.1 hypothetical protein [Bryobacterales bacterium]
MTPRFKMWQIAAAIVLIAGAAIAFVEWSKTRTRYDATQLLSCLPAGHAVRLYIDVNALRSRGLLDGLEGGQTAQEPDYVRFVQATGFDYRKDLNAVAAEFANGDVYMALHGNFDWKRLSNYAESQGGKCSGSLCSMGASRPNRTISYSPLSANLLALAVAADDRAASKIFQPKVLATGTGPSPAIWLFAPGEAFTDLSGLPDGSHILSPLAEAKEASFEVRDNEIRLDALCSSPDTAVKIVEKFTATTSLLRSMLQRDSQTPNPSDLSGILVAGKFLTRADHVIGTWPLQKEFIEKLLSGGAR